MNKNEIIEKIIEYFDEHEEIFNQCIEELDSYNGWLNEDRYYPMEEINEILYNENLIDVIQMAIYGNDESYPTFNVNREFFRFNAYGNLVSSDYKDYSDYLDEYAITEMNEHREYIFSIDDEENIELAELFNQLEKALETE